MPTPPDLLADLPAPRDDEPASLRQDILDELSDHLSCAFHRELVKSGDEQTAQQRVLDRFGDPRRIAYQLWFQAMWSRIMSQRISMGLQGLLVVGVLAVAFLMFRVLDYQSRMHDEWQALRNQSASNQQMLTALLQRFPAPAEFSDAGGMSAEGGYDAGMGGAMMPGAMPGTPTASGMGMMMGGGDMASTPQTPPNLVVRVVMEGDNGAAAANYLLEVQDENGQGIPAWVGGHSAAYGEGYGGEGSSGGMPGGDSGVMGYGPGRQMWVDQPQPDGSKYANVPPDRYTAIVEFPDGRVGRQRFAVLPKETKTVTVVCPPAVEPSLVTLVGPKLEQIDPAFEIRAGVTITRPKQKLGNTEWTVKDAPSWEVWFDPATGLVTSLESPVKIAGGPSPKQPLTFDDSDPPDTRFVSLKGGVYQVDWKFLLVWKDGRSVADMDLNPRDFKVGPLDVELMSFDAEPGSTTWTLTVPEMRWSVVQEQAKKLERETRGTGGHRPKPPPTATLSEGDRAARSSLRMEGFEGVELYADGVQGPVRLTLPRMVAVQSEQTHRFQLSVRNNPGKSVTAELQFPRIEPETQSLLAQLHPTLVLPDVDVEAALQGEVMVRVFYLTNVDGRHEIKVLLSELVPNDDPLEVARSLGTAFAVWRIEPPKPSKPTDAAGPTAREK